MDGIATDALMRPAAWENEAIVSVPIRTVLHLADHRECLIGQRYLEVFVFDFHPLGWNCPKLFVEVDLGPLRTPSFFQSDTCQDQEPEHADSHQSRSLAYRHQLGIDRRKLAVRQRCDGKRLRRLARQMVL